MQKKKFVLYFRAIINRHCITGLLIIKTNVVGGTPHNGLYGEALPERGTFFRPQVYEMVLISMVEVYERVGKPRKILRIEVGINLEALFMQFGTFFMMKAKHHKMKCLFSLYSFNYSFITLFFKFILLF